MVIDRYSDRQQFYLKHQPAIWKNRRLGTSMYPGLDANFKLPQEQKLTEVREWLTSGTK